MELNAFEITIELRIPEWIVVDNFTAQSQTILPKWRRGELNTRFALEGGSDPIPAGCCDMMSLIYHQVTAHVHQHPQGSVFE